MRSKSGIYLEILDGIRCFQKRNRAVGYVGEVRIGLLESHLLTEIESFESISGVALAEVLKVPKQEVSRLGAKFVGEGLLKLGRQRGGDKRTRLFSLTSSGRSFVLGVDRSANPILASIVSKLSTKERALFRRSLSLISDAAGVVVTTPRPGEPLVRSEIRRITRALTLMRRKIFDSSINPTEWHILSELKSVKEGKSVSEVALELNLSLATASACLKKLSRRKMTGHVRTKEDARHKRYFITSRGLLALKAANSKGAKIIEAGLSSVPFKDKALLVRVLNKI